MVCWDINICFTTNSCTLRNIVRNIENVLGKVKAQDPNHPTYRVSETRVICRNVNGYIDAAIQTFFINKHKLHFNLQQTKVYCTIHNQPKSGYLVPNFFLNS